ncbi:MAG: UPF0175 family protein [Verrucomicrobiaceae bacterium]|nr:UPF0175 family protein [Verrucomicrobiaceae bacterium]
MSHQVLLELPDTVFSALRTTPASFVREMRVPAAKWYELGKVSQSKAAKIASVSRREFLEAVSVLRLSATQENAGRNSCGTRRCSVNGWSTPRR